MSWGRWETSQGLPVLSCKLYKTALQRDSCDLCSHTANTPKISEWESNKRVVGRGHWCTLFLPFAFHNKSISASCLPSMHHCTLTISFLLFLITKKFMAAQTALVNKWPGIVYFQVWAYFRIQQWLWGQDEWFNHALWPLIYPTCLIICVINENCTASSFVLHWLTVS